MQVRIVRKAEIRPMKCVFYPQIGHDHPKGYVDTGMDMLGVDPHAYISIQAIEDIASHLGWLTPAENKRMCEELATAHEKIIQLEDENNKLDEEAQAIDVLRGRGYQPRGRPGRKPKKQEHDPDLVA